MSDLASHGNVLVIAEDRESAERLTHWVAATGEQPMVIVGADSALLQHGSDDSVDLVVTDLNTGQSSALQLLDRLLTGEVLFGVPQIHVVRDLAIQDRIAELNPHAAAISLADPAEARGFQARVHLAAEVGRLRRELLRVSIHDELTGTANRRFLLTRLGQEFSRARRYRTPLSLVLFDIDRLAAINRRHGLAAGDLALRRIAGVLAAQVRKEDIHGRWGGGSFAAILPGTRPRGAATFASKIRGDSEACHIELPDGETIPVTVSAGVSYIESRGIDNAKPMDLVTATENALVESKRRGGNRVFIDEAALRGERSLIVIADPDAELLDLAEDLLSTDAFRVIRSDSRTNLLETLKYRRPDLLILDLEIAGPGDAGDLVRAVRGLHPDHPLPIVALASEPGATVAAATQAGIDRLITKPFSISVLRSVARELLSTETAASDASV